MMNAWGFLLRSFGKGFSGPSGPKGTIFGGIGSPITSKCLFMNVFV